MTEPEDLGETTDERPEYELSASRIKTFQSCPLKYKFKYIDGKQSTKYQQGYGALGSLVHEAIENVLRENPDLRDQSILIRKLKAEYEDLKDDEYREEMQTIIDDRQDSDGIGCLEGAARFIANGPADVPDREWEFEIMQEPMGVEAEALFDVDHHAIEGKTFLGYVDLATDDGIWDWKTGRIRDDTGRDELIQGSVYMAAYNYLYGEMPENIRFIYLKEEKIRSVEPSHDNWQEMVKYARTLLNAKESDNFPGRPGDQCYWCGYETWCPASPVGAGNVAYEQF